MVPQQDILQAINEKYAAIHATLAVINNARAEHNSKLEALEDLIEQHPGLPKYDKPHELSAIYAQMNSAQNEADRAMFNNFNTYGDLYIRYLVVLREYSFTARDILALQGQMQELVYLVFDALGAEQNENDEDYENDDNDVNDENAEDLLFVMDSDVSIPRSEVKPSPEISNDTAQKLNAIMVWLQVSNGCFNQMLVELDKTMTKMVLECEEDVRFEKLLFGKLRQLPELKNWVRPWINDHELGINGQVQAPLTALKQAMATLPETSLLTSSNRVANK